MLNKIQLLVVFLLILSAFFVRFYKIEQVPASLYYDEIDLGYQARSLVQTGKDYRGTLSPFYVNSFNSQRTPIPAYFTALTTLIFKSPELQVRFPFVIFGTLVVLLSFILTKIWTKDFKKALLVGLIFATSPWQIQFSRWAHEGVIMLAFYLLALIFFYQAIKIKKYLYFLISMILFSLCVYTYRTMSFYLPLTLIVLLVLYWKEISIFGWKKIGSSLVLSFIIVSSFLYATTAASFDQPRINQISIFSDQSVPVTIQRAREVASGDLTDGSIGKKAALASYFFHNKPLLWLNTFANNYFESFSAEFLFINGDPNLRQSVGKMGELYKIDILGLIFAIIFLFKNFSKKEYKFLLIWLLTSPIPSSLTLDGAGHAGRLFIYSAPLLIFIGLGWGYFFTILSKYRFFKPTSLILFGVWSLMFIFFLQRYFIHYPIESENYFGYGYKQAFLKIDSLKNNYQDFYLSTASDPPMLYFLFWSNIPPRDIQKYGSNFSLGNSKGGYLDHYKVINWRDEIDRKNSAKESSYSGLLKPDILYLLTTSDIPHDYRSDPPPPGVKLIDTIKYLDKEVVFYLLTKD